MVSRAAAFAVLVLLGSTSPTLSESRYFGKEIGRLSQLEHGVRGSVFAVDSRTLYIHRLYYDGEGPSAFFFVGTSKTPSAKGATKLRDERGSTGPLRKYRGESITLSLPEGITLKDIKWLSIYCDEYSVNFGDVSIPRELEYPRPARLGALSGVHGVSSDPIVVVDAQTLLVPNFSYDGEAPDAKFWVGRGDKPSPQGVRIPDENGKEAPLRRYDKKTIVLTLPGELTVFDIGHFAVWCEAFTVNFGHVVLPRAKLANVPPSLKMLGVSPQSKLNCEVLYDELAFEVRWAVAGDSIVLQLVAKLEDGEYMSFGVSGDNNRSQMVGGDVAVAWLDKNTLKGYAHDYYLDAKSQCAGVRGSCPDERLGEKTNSIRLLNAALVNGYSIVTYQRSLKATDELDRPILTNTSQPIIWAIGPLNSKNEVSYHSHFLKNDKFIEFGRPPVWNCPMPESEEDNKEPEKETERRPAEVQGQKEVAHPHQTAVIKPNPVPTPKPAERVKPWEIPAIQCNEPEDGVFYAQMGPTGGKQGYPAITGHVGWGLSWYINGLLIPEINVIRGKKYTFVTEGGSNPDEPARYHPFYITNDPVGGYFHKSEQEKQGVEIYAGVRRTRSGELVPVGVGRLCNWTPDSNGPTADEYPSFGAYQRSLTLVCESGNPGFITWTPDKSTPDTVYYQCYTHRHLGWKINVLDECDVTDAEESRVIEKVLPPPKVVDDDLLEGEESIQVPSRVKPDTNFLLDNYKKVEKIINTKPAYNDFSDFGQEEYYNNPAADIYIRQQEKKYQSNQSNQEYELPISNAQITEVINAAENLENKVKEEYMKNMTSNNNSYQNINGMFLPEQPIREGDEYVVAHGNVPSNFMLPPNQKPLTLQAVMRPHSPNGKPSGPMRTQFRRPGPPEIKLRRPTQYPKGSFGFPLSMPNPQIHHPPMQKKPYGKYPNGRPIQSQQHQMRPPIQISNVPPMKAMPPIGPSPVYNPPPMKQATKPPGMVQSIIMGKPTVIYPQQSQTLSLGKSDIIANQIVKSQITLPGVADLIGQFSAPQQYLAKPTQTVGNIILGKPMENPVPLDQQMIPTKLHSVIKAPVTLAPEYHQTTLRIKADDQSQPDIKPSDFIDESREQSTLIPAKNTGFKPDSIVIESGFKPIIREPLMASEDRITDFDKMGGNNNRREDTDIEEEYHDDRPQYIHNNHAYTPNEKITESFEPMFIPSPEDHLLPTNDRTKEVFPSNHAKEERPHPVYVSIKSNFNNLFSEKNMEKEMPEDLAMESDRVSPQYLPPDSNIPKQQLQKILAQGTFTSYDGKTVSADTLTSIPDFPMASSQHPSKLTPNFDVSKLPQFGPYRGDISDEVTKQLSGIPTGDAPINHFDARTTQLKLVNTYKDTKPQKDDSLLAEGSEIKEMFEKSEPDNEQKFDSYHDEKTGTEETVEKYILDNERNDDSKNEDKNDKDSQNEDYSDDEEYELEEPKKRYKRETRTTQFEQSVTQHTATQKESLTKNQIDFEAHTDSASLARNNWLTNSVLLLLLLKFL